VTQHFTQSETNWQHQPTHWFGADYGGLNLAQASPHGRAVRADIRACHRHAMTTPLFQLLDYSGTAFGAGS